MPNLKEKTTKVPIVNLPEHKVVHVTNIILASAASGNISSDDVVSHDILKKDLILALDKKDVHNAVRELLKELIANKELDTLLHG